MEQVLAFPAAQQPAVSRACSVMWTATTGMMSTFMRSTAPGHRLVVARKIAQNLGVLGGDPLLSAECRRSFGNLGQRWEAKVLRLGLVTR